MEMRMGEWIRLFPDATKTFYDGRSIDPWNYERYQDAIFKLVKVTEWCDKPSMHFSLVCM